MKFSILHLSDLHRDLKDEVSNAWLLESLYKDFNQFEKQNPTIIKPAICIVSGDIVQGAGSNIENPKAELTRQYDQAEEFLIGLADRFFNGDRERVVILPGNHDVSYIDSLASFERVETPTDLSAKGKLVKELSAADSQLRWSWKDLCFFRIVDQDLYLDRFRYFSSLYNTFYQGKRTYDKAPENQFDVFDFADLGFSVITLNSCFNNDPFKRAGSFHPNALLEASKNLRDGKRVGWLTAAAWHHNLVGGPAQDDYVDAYFLQILIDSGVSLGFHGHQHLPECFDERYRLGENPRKITIMSASTLCADPNHLRPGIPRSYNVAEVDTDDWKGRLHQRQMVSQVMNMPVWGPGHFISTNKSYIDFEISKPLQTRPASLNIQIALDEAETLIGLQSWQAAFTLLENLQDTPLARSLFVRALEGLGDDHLIISKMWPPYNSMEVVLLGGAILNVGSKVDAEAFIKLPIVASDSDATIRDISRRVTERLTR